MQPRLQRHGGYDVDLPGYPRQRVVDRSRIAFSMQSFLEIYPIPAAYPAMSFSRAQASGPARPYVSWLSSTKRQYLRN